MAVAILGPTASGKSRLGLELAARMDGEILSIDSRQAYRRIDIGTAKPSPEERRRVPHHLIDILDLDEKSNAQAFALLARAAAQGVVARGRIPFFVGGSGLYFRAIETGFFDVALEASDRAAFSAAIRDVPTGSLHERLQGIDPESARRIHPNDRYRIVRALEVQALTGTPLSEHLRRQRDTATGTGISFVKIGLNVPRGRLHRNIEERTRTMFARGWDREVERLLGEGVDPAWPGMRTLGYPEVVSFVKGAASREETIGRVTELTRQYAKRQVTWFRKEPEMHWIDAGGEGLMERAAALLARRGGG